MSMLSFWLRYQLQQFKRSILSLRFRFVRQLWTLTQTKSGSRATSEMERTMAYPDRIYVELHGTNGSVNT
jgi:hypothetical protein